MRLKFMRKIGAIIKAESKGVSVECALLNTLYISLRLKQGAKTEEMSKVPSMVRKHI